MSYSFAVYYVKTDLTPEALGKGYGRVQPAGPGWLACSYGQGNVPEEEAFSEDPEVFASGALSERFGEALYLFADSASDQLSYDHSQGGVLVRKLLWQSDGCQLSWACAAGAPEPWEAALFSPQQQAQTLGWVDPEQAEEVRQIYKRQRIETGARFPSCDATVADLIEAHFGIQRPKK